MATLPPVVTSPVPVSLFCLSIGEQWHGDNWQNIRVGSSDASKDHVLIKSTLLLCKAILLFDHLILWNSVCISILDRIVVYAVLTEFKVFRKLTWMNFLLCQTVSLVSFYLYFCKKFLLKVLSAKSCYNRTEDWVLVYFQELANVFLSIFRLCRSMD